MTLEQFEASMKDRPREEVMRLFGNWATGLANAARKDGADAIAEAYKKIYIELMAAKVGAPIPYRDGYWLMLRGITDAY